MQAWQLYQVKKLIHYFFHFHQLPIISPLQAWQLLFGSQSLHVQIEL